jgi:hypothetical protein
MTGMERTSPGDARIRYPALRGVATRLRPDSSSGFIDYRLARRALVRQVTRGIVPITDVCDAHPELLRAARNIGRPTARTCPICRLADDRADVPLDETETLRLVTYVFGDDLNRMSGHVVWTVEEIEELARRHRFTAYVVECCLVCGWNHLVESYLMGRDAG